VGRILRGPFHGTFFFSRHTCVSWLLNPYTGLGQYNRIYFRSQESHRTNTRGNMFFFSHEVCVESQTAQLFTVRYLFVFVLWLSWLRKYILSRGSWNWQKRRERSGSLTELNNTISWKYSGGLPEGTKNKHQNIETRLK